jgi:hypothetical protein
VTDEYKSKRSLIGFGLILIEFRLEEMSAYLDFFGGALQQRLSELDTSYQEAIASDMTEDEVANAHDHYSERFQEAEREFPQLLLLSFIATWYSFVEQNLLNLCEELELKISIGPKVKDKFGEGIERAYKFLKDVGKYKFDENHWQELNDIKCLRNIIVHEGKQLDSSYDKPEGYAISYVIRDKWALYVPMKESLHHYLEKHSMISQNGTSVEIMPTLDYCRSLIAFGHELFSKLYADLG